MPHAHAQVDLLHTLNPRTLTLLGTLLASHVRVGKRAIVFADTIQVLEYCSRRFSAEMLHGSTSDEKVSRVLAAFTAGKLPLLFLSDAFSDGFDFGPVSLIAEIEIIGGSRRQLLQRAGRGSRNRRPSALEPSPSQAQCEFVTFVTKESNFEKQHEVRLCACACARASGSGSARACHCAWAWACVLAQARRACLSDEAVQMAHSHRHIKFTDLLPRSCKGTSAAAVEEQAKLKASEQTDLHIHAHACAHAHMWKGSPNARRGSEPHAARMPRAHAHVRPSRWAHVST